jgi:hypothetical protein
LRRSFASPFRRDARRLCQQQPASPSIGQHLVSCYLSVWVSTADDFAEPEVDPGSMTRGPSAVVIPPQIAPQPGDYYVRKHTYSRFRNSLDSVLRNLNAETLLCAGFVADVCMLFALGDAVSGISYGVRDCTLAPRTGRGGRSSHAQRMIIWMEKLLGASATSKILWPQLGNGYKD